MAAGINGREKLDYAEGTKVSFDYDGTVTGTGFIRGLSSRHLVDMWIVEVETMIGQDPALYPWSCIVVPHTCLQVT